MQDSQSTTCRAAGHRNGLRPNGDGCGLVTSTVYALIVPVLMLVFAISTGSRLIAGDEESGDLELEATSR